MSDKILQATHDGTLKIGDLEIECAVLKDGTRVVSERAFSRALGSKRGGSHWIRKRSDDGAKLPVYMSAKRLKSFIPKDLSSALSKPIIYQGIKGGRANGVEATWIPKILEVWLKARDEGVLLKSQLDIAEKADILMRGLAHVGIVALVDEATGYQNVRARRALEEILEKYIAKELHKWVKTFPDEFYEHMFKLRGWQYSPLSVKRPALVGKLTNNVVYERLAPGVLDELRKKNPKRDSGGRKHKHHQWLTPKEGHPKLREHLASVITLMKVSPNWRKFVEMLNRALPKWGDLPLMDFGENVAADRENKEKIGP